jgi:hypothetical protein
MKRALAFFVCGGMLFLGSCADTLEQPTTEEVQERFERGISGEGRIGPLDRSDDRYVRPAEPSGPQPQP